MSKMINKKEIEEIINNKTEKDFKFLVYLLSVEHFKRKKLEKRIEILEKQFQEMKK